jgi:hypothetical protein
MVAPFGDPDYYKLRNEIALPRPKAGDADVARYQPEHGASYPADQLGKALMQVRKHLGVHDLASIFPHFEVRASNEPGVLRA